MAAKYKAPGVYIEEVSAFSTTVSSVSTAIPAFVGYTPQSSFNGESFLNVPIKITSLTEFYETFGFSTLGTTEPVKKPYNPQYYLLKHESRPDSGEYITINEDLYSIVPDPNTIYYLYNSVKMFYQNGGGSAYIVCVGTYGPVSNTPVLLNSKIVNPNVRLEDLQNGIAVLKNVVEVTMYICPDATLLSINNYGALMQFMLFQNFEMQTAISLFDVIGGDFPNPILFHEDIDLFRAHTGSIGLSYGCAYYPFLETVMMNNNDIDFTNLFGGDTIQLESILNSVSAPSSQVTEIFNTIKNIESTDFSIADLNSALLSASSAYALIIQHVLRLTNILPPSGAMAGVITRTDTNYGVWKAPANTSIIGASSLTFNLSNKQQEALNVDAVSGKSINALRLFTGKGILVWGARTLDGNSNEYRYIPVRRLLIYIKQSFKESMEAYVFERNNSNTWSSVKNMISVFLINLWRNGALPGSKPESPFYVKCGLNETMTSLDILDDNLIVEVGVAVVRPAEFIVFKLHLKLETSS